MKKIQYYEYGSSQVMKLEEVARPTPNSNEVLVKVRAAGINELDWKIRNGNLQIQDGKGFPKAMGCEFSGDVVQAGEAVDGFATGDAVFGWIPFSQLGAFAEYAVVDCGLLRAKPVSLSYVEAAALPMVGATALQALTQEVSLSPGKKVLINGATGGVGHLAVQIARQQGATVTAVAGTEHIEFAQTLGADTVIDYHKQNVRESSNLHDVILDTSKQLPWDEAKKLLTKEGTYIDLQPGLKAFIGSFLQNTFSSKTHDVLGVEVKQRDLEELALLVESGDLKVTVEHIFKLSNYQSALSSLESGSVSSVGKAVFEIDI